MQKIKKILLVTVGLISIGLGVIGVILPIIPTTPFLLLASVCFVKGSDRFDQWFKGTKLYKKHLETFVESKKMTLKQKITILAVADAMLLIPFITVNNLHMRIFLIVLVLCKFYYFFFRIETIKVKEEKAIN